MKGMSAADKKQQRKWEVDNAMSTLQRAEQIKKDPSMMREVRKAATELSKAVGASKIPPKKKK